MDSDNQKLRDILVRAAEMPHDQRDAFLNESCGGDKQLRSRVEALLGTLQQADSFLADPTFNTAEAVDSAMQSVPEVADRSGERIGRYKLLQQIGEGGMGVVFMAEQEEPVRRRVALKIIKPGMETRQVIARFEAERQALAVMDHPNIARVYDAGATGSGQPYFVMELVRGTPLTEYCDKRGLTTRERLELLVPVCQAVQHAHSKGIIHRDLKPSNVLVTIADGKPVPKVIDFGVAKATQSRLTEKTLFTEFRQLLGTPQYMSPEQAESNGIDVDTQSDVYSLGILLYELLTGTTPLDGKELRSKAYVEMERMIRESEPPLPSTRLSTMGDGAKAVALQRKTEPRELGQTLRGELDWIVMRALEKDRSRRYETASGLARDIERYLADEPVEACPPSASYRVRKFVRKHRLAIGITAAFTIVLISAAVISTWQAVRAMQATRIARQLAANELALRISAQKSATSEASQRRQAESVARLLESLFRGVDPHPEGKPAVDLRTQLLAQLHESADALEADHANDPLLRARLRNALAETELGIGETRSAEKLLEAALADQRTQLPPDDPAILSTMHNLARAYSNDDRHLDAIKLFEHVRDRRSATLGPNHLDTLSTLDRLAWAYHGAERYTDMVKLLEFVQDQRLQQLGPDNADTLQTQQSLADGYKHLERYQDSIALFVQVRDRQTKIFGPSHFDVLTTLHDLANVYFETGRLHEAIALYEQVRDEKTAQYGPFHPYTFTTLNTLARTYAASGRVSDAITLYEKVLKQELAAPELQAGPTAYTVSGLFLILQSADRVSEGVITMERARDEMIRRVGLEHPDTWKVMEDLANAYRFQGRINDYVKQFEQLCDLRARKLGPEDKGTLDTLSKLARAYVYAGRTDEGIALLERVRSKRPKDADLLELNYLATAYERTQRLAEAVKFYEQATDLARRSLGTDHAATQAIMRNLAYAYAHAKKFPEMIRLLEELRNRRVVSRGSGHRDTVRATLELIQGYKLAGRDDEAFGVREQLLMTSSSDPRTLSDCGTLLAQMGRFDEAAADFTRAIELSPENHHYWHDGLMPLLLQLGDTEGFRTRLKLELAQFKSTTDAVTAHRVTKDAFSIPLDGEDLKAAVELADVAIRSLDETKHDAVQDWVCQTRGMLEYRCDHFQAAIHWFEKLIARAPGDQFVTEANLFIAMSYERLGGHSAALAAFETADNTIETKFPELWQDLGNFPDWILCHVLRREAKEVIFGKGPGSRQVEGITGSPNQ